MQNPLRFNPENIQTYFRLISRKIFLTFLFIWILLFRPDPKNIKTRLLKDTFLLNPDNIQTYFQSYRTLLSFLREKSLLILRFNFEMYLPLLPDVLAPIYDAGLRGPLIVCKLHNIPPAQVKCNYINCKFHLETWVYFIDFER